MRTPTLLRARSTGPAAGPHSAFERAQSTSLTDLLTIPSRVPRFVNDSYASPEDREGDALDRGLVRPDTAARKVDPLFLRAGVRQFAGSVLGTIKDVLAIKHRRPVFPMVARTLLQIMLTRTTVELDLRMLADPQGAVKDSPVEQRAASRSCDVH